MGLAWESQTAGLRTNLSLPCCLRWMGRTGSDFCDDASMCRHSSGCSAAGLQEHGREAAAVTGRDLWGGTAGMSEL